MELTAWQVHRSWLVRASLVLIVTGMVDGLTAWFVPHPLLWCALIGSSLPLSMVAFVVIPMLRQERRQSLGR